MKRPAEMHLSREDGEALRQRLDNDALTAADRRVLGHVLEWYLWLLFTVQEAKLSLRRLRRLLFGEPPNRRKGPPPGAPGTDAHSSEGGRGNTSSQAGEAQGTGAQRPGHGRHSAQAYGGAQRVACRHEALAIGQRCPVCGRGRLYPVAPGVAMRINGHALLSAIRYELEKRRCSAGGQIFTAPLPEAAGGEKYSARARAVLVMARYYLGVPLYRLEEYQAMVGVSVADATQWDQIERVADCAYPVFEHLQALAAQGELIYQDDTHVRILSLIAANRQAHADNTSGARTGMYTTALVAQQGAQTICLYFSGRAHAGENLATLLTQRAADRGKPLVMSDALAMNDADETALLRCHCLAHGRRKFVELEDVFPQECAVVMKALAQVFDHDEEARLQQLSAPERLAYYQHVSGPIMQGLQHWLEQQFADRTVEPNSSLGKAFRYLLTHWQTLTRFLEVPGAPLENNTAERALKLAIRQRKNSLFYATDYSASIASMLTSLIATCLHAGVNALDYLVALQEHRTAVFRAPAAWLPWNYHLQFAPS
jgi:transposase